MGTYFHGNQDIQSDALHTLFLMNPPYLGYPQSHTPTNFLLLNPHAPHYVDNTHARDPPRLHQPLSLCLSPDNRWDGVVLSSKYLKAARMLLEEVVNVGNGIADDSENKAKSNPNLLREASGPSALGGGDKHGVDLTAGERHEIQRKKSKLMGMLDEVELRYRQYHEEVQLVVSTFENVAGLGSGKIYTSLALHTISKQFRCLKDSISAQIRYANMCLGQDESSDSKYRGSRLKHVDHQVRQQRALQLLGMMPNHNAWRPQRGLPERSVSVLRAWLFEHFLHPYPKDSDKHMLAKQTGLTRNQVSNWFINARVRLWKPMVEEMYLEEVKEREPNSSADKTIQTQSSQDTNHDVTITQGSPKKPRNTESFLNGILPSTDMEMNGSNEFLPVNYREDRQNGDEYSLMSANFIVGLGSYPVDLEQYPHRFPTNGNVSLTLGLPDCESINLSGCPNFLANTENVETNSSTNAYEDMNIQNRNWFAAQLLPDFVA